MDDASGLIVRGSPASLGVPPIAPSLTAHREPVNEGNDTPTLRNLDLSEHLADPSRRQGFVTRMFDIIAPRYDRFTRAFSFWMDAGWKRELLDAAPPLRPGDLAIDLACGTGDLALGVGGRSHGVTVLGLDASHRMVGEARRRARGLRVALSVGDMAALPLRDACAQLATVGYGFRNVPDARAAIAEAARVLASGGTLLVLDFYRPPSRPWRTLFLGYLRVAGNLVGWLWHGEGVVYGYIAPSIAMYMTAADFSRALRDAGFDVARVRPKLFGGVALHVAVKRPTPDPLLA